MDIENEPNSAELNTGADTGDAGADPVINAEEPAAPIYEPNYKFKIRNEEREFDEWIRPAIKDKDHEEHLRGLYTRADALDDVVKTRDQVMQERNQIVSQLGRAGDLLQKGRVFDAVQILGIPQKAIFQAVIEKLQYEELPPEQRQAYDQRRQAEMDADRSQGEASDLRGRYQDAILDLRQIQIQTALAEPQVQEVAAALSTALASRGQSFEDLVIREGALEYQLTGKDLSVKEAVSRVVDHYRPLLGQASPMITPQEQVMRKTTPKSIPTLGRAGAPTAAPKVRTLADLVKLRASRGM